MYPKYENIFSMISVAGLSDDSHVNTLYDVVANVGNCAGHLAVFARAVLVLAVQSSVAQRPLETAGVFQHSRHR